MTPVYQINETSYGDCFRCCIASLLDMKREDVPHFYDGVPCGHDVPREITNELDRWMADRGWAYFEFGFFSEPDVVLKEMAARQPRSAYVMIGGNARGAAHAVVCRDGNVVHDPACPPGVFCRPLTSASDGTTRVGIIAKLC